MSRLGSYARSVGSRLTYANVVSTLALVAVLTTGGAYAATKLINGAQIKPGTVHTKQLGKGSVTNAKLAPGSVTARNLAKGVSTVGPRGPVGAPGAKGEKGDTGTVDTSDFYDKAASDARFQPRLDHVKMLGGGTPAQNGAALLAAVTAIGTPSGPADAWLVKLQPGSYDLGDATLTLRPYVELEGSGVNSTTVSSAKDVNPGPSTIVGATHSEVRDLTVAASTTASVAVVAVRIDAGTDGFSVRDAALVATGGKFAQGLVVNGGSAVLDRVTSTATSDAGIANAQAFAVSTFGAVTVRNSLLRASVGTGGLAGVSLISQGGTSVVVVNSVLWSTQYALYNNAGATIRVVDSQLDAPNTVSGAATCLGAWKGNYTATSTTCT